MVGVVATPLLSHFLSYWNVEHQTFSWSPTPLLCYYAVVSHEHLLQMPVPYSRGNSAKLVSEFASAL